MNYFYQGISLREYCQNNNLDYQKYKARFRRLFDKNMPEEEIYQIIFDDTLYSLTNEKYYYEGMPLCKYCYINNVDYYNTIRRMKKILSTKKDLTQEEAIRIALDDALFFNVNGKFKYFYNGIPLRKYCIKNNIDYKSIINRIRRLNRIYDNLSTEEILQLVMNNDLYNKTKNLYLDNVYHYGNMTLRKYCFDNNINYSKIMGRIGRLNELKLNFSKNQLVSIALEDNEYYKYIEARRVNKYKTYKGMTLKNYCKINNIDFVKVLEEICKIDESGTSLTEEEVILLAINRQNDEFIQNELKKKIDGQTKPLTKVLKKI